VAFQLIYTFAYVSYVASDGTIGRPRITRATGRDTCSLSRACGRGEFRVRNSLVAGRSLFRPRHPAPSTSHLPRSGSRRYQREFRAHTHTPSVLPPPPLAGNLASHLASHLVSLSRWIDRTGLSPEVRSSSMRGSGRRNVPRQGGTRVLARRSRDLAGLASETAEENLRFTST